MPHRPGRKLNYYATGQSLRTRAGPQLAGHGLLPRPLYKYYYINYYIYIIIIILYNTIYKMAGDGALAPHPCKPQLAGQGLLAVQLRPLT